MCFLFNFIKNRQINSIVLRASSTTITKSSQPAFVSLKRLHPLQAKFLFALSFISDALHSRLFYRTNKRFNIAINFTPKLSTFLHNIIIFDKTLIKYFDISPISFKMKNNVLIHTSAHFRKTAC